MQQCHEDDFFWLHFGPVMFEEERWAAAVWEAEEAVRLLQIPPGGSILDACCGVGRHSLEFAHLGYRVTGVDRTEGYLEAAMDSAEADGMDIEFVLEDVRRFCRKNSFDGIVNMFTSFGYFETIEEEQQTLLNFYTSLKPNAKLLIDVIGKELLARNFTTSEWYEHDGGFVISRYAIKDDWTKLWNRWIYYKEGERYEYSFAHRVFSAQELKNLLLQTGFRQVDIFGTLEGDPYDEHADRLIALARK
jgi:SAM-dependent methyltransferase